MDDEQKYVEEFCDDSRQKRWEGIDYNGNTNEVSDVLGYTDLDGFVVNVDDWDHIYLSMNYRVPSGFEGDHFARLTATNLIGDILNEEKWEIDQNNDRIFKNLIGRKCTRPIDEDTERELFIRYKQGDMDALNVLVYANLRLVYSVARHLRPNKLTCNDLISEGLIGLLKAIDNFDVNRYFRFSTFAYGFINNHIRCFLNYYNSPIVFSGPVYSLRKRYIKFIEKYYQENLCQPTDTEVADALIIPQFYATAVRECLDKPFSYDHLCDFLGYEFVNEDLIEDVADLEPETFDTSFNYESFLIDITESLKHLNPRDDLIIRMNYGIGCRCYSLDEIGLKFDLSRERIRQIREKAIKKLRGDFGNNLAQYLDENFEWRENHLRN